VTVEALINSEGKQANTAMAKKEMRMLECFSSNDDNHQYEPATAGNGNVIYEIRYPTDPILQLDKMAQATVKLSLKAIRGHRKWAI